jgi:hypothetical protein
VDVADAGVGERVGVEYVEIGRAPDSIAPLSDAAPITRAGTMVAT